MSPDPTPDNNWLTALHLLLLRHPELGAAGDLAGMTRAEAWGLYCYLSRLALG